MVVQLPQDHEKYPIGRTIVGTSPDYQRFNRVMYEYISRRKTGKNASVQANFNCDGDELWRKRFNRWWGWNWLRKRKENISKFKLNLCDKENLRAVKRAFNIGSTITIPKFIRKQFDTPDEYSNSTRIITPHKPIDSTVRSSKYKFQERESWLVEDSTSIEDESIKTQPEKPKQTLPESTKQLHNFENYTSKKPNLKFDKYLDKNDTIKSIDVGDQNYIPSTKFPWLQKFDYLKKEHKKIMDKINKNDGDNKLNDTETISENLPVLKPLDVPESFPFYEAVSKCSSSYDINYLTNNILSFSSQISDLRFLNCYETKWN